MSIIIEHMRFVTNARATGGSEDAKQINRLIHGPHPSDFGDFLVGFRFVFLKLAVSVLLVLRGFQL